MWNRIRTFLPLPPPTGLPSSVRCSKFGKLSSLAFRRNLISLGKTPCLLLSFPCQKIYLKLSQTKQIQNGMKLTSCIHVNHPCTCPENFTFPWQKMEFFYPSLTLKSFSPIDPSRSELKQKRGHIPHSLSTWLQQSEKLTVDAVSVQRKMHTWPDLTCKYSMIKNKIHMPNYY